MAGADGTCRGCDRRWTGLKEAHCSVCHEHFSSPYTFDAHRDRGRCKQPGRVKIGDRKLKKVQRASGPVWSLDLDDIYGEDEAA